MTDDQFDKLMRLQKLQIEVLANIEAKGMIAIDLCSQILSNLPKEISQQEIFEYIDKQVKTSRGPFYQEKYRKAVETILSE